VIEEDCIIYQCVTIGTSFDCDNKMPTIKKGTTISTGAKIIGDITIGRNCIIGANAVVTKDIPDNCTVVGANKIIKRDLDE
jgi:serine O-acetyltransferase